MKSVLLLNDTSNELHIGSAAISSMLSDFVEQRGCKVSSATFLNGCYHVPNGEYDFVIVNAEGTLSRESLRSAALISEIKRLDAPMAFVSADLSHQSAAQLRGKEFRLVHYRRHHEENQRLDTDAEYILPDLFYHIVKKIRADIPHLPEKIRPYWVLGDSHNLFDFAEMQRFAASVSTPLKPQSMLVESMSSTGFRMSVKQRLRNRLWFVSRNKTSAWRKRYRAATIETWVQTLARSQGVITGRFHQAVAALAVDLPVLYHESQTTKIRSLGELFNASDLQSILAPPTSHVLNIECRKNAHLNWDYSAFFLHLSNTLES